MRPRRRDARARSTLMPAPGPTTGCSRGSPPGRGAGGRRRCRRRPRIRSRRPPSSSPVSNSITAICGGHIDARWRSGARELERYAQRGAAGGATDGRLAIHTFASCPPGGISLLADGALPLGGDALLLQHEAPAAARQPLDRRLAAAHAAAGRAPVGIAPAVECASCLAAWLADGAIVLRPAAAAGCAEARVQPFLPPPPVAGAVCLAAPLGVAAGVWLSLLAGPGAAGLLGGTALLGTSPAHLQTGRRRELAAPGAGPAGGASGMPLTVAAIPLLLLRGVSERHDRPPRSARVAGGAQARGAEPPNLHARAGQIHPGADDDLISLGPQLLDGAEGRGGAPLPAPALRLRLLGPDGTDLSVGETLVSARSRSDRPRARARTDESETSVHRDETSCPCA